MVRFEALCRALLLVASLPRAAFGGGLVTQVETTLNGASEPDTASNDAGFGALRLADDSYVFTGTSGGDILFARVDRTGNMLYRRQFGGDGYDRGVALVELPNGQIMVMGYGASTPDAFQGVWILGFRATDGQLLWNNTHGHNTQEQLAAELRLVNNSQAVVTCGMTYYHTNSSNNRGVHNQYWIIAFDLVGNVIWETTFDSRNWDGATQVIELPDGGLLVTGVAGRYEHYVKLSASGQILWSHQRYWSGVPAHMTYAADGNLLVFGRTHTSDIFLRKIDLNANSIWYRTYGGRGGEWAYQILRMPEGGLMLVGETTSHGAGGSDVWFLRTDDNGIVLYTATRGGVSDEWIHDMHVNDNSEIMGFGLTKSFGMRNGNWDVYILGVAEVEPTATLRGRCFIDNDFNNVWSAGDEALANRRITVTPGPFITFTDNDGRYSMRLEPGQYSVTMAVAVDDLWQTFFNPLVANVTLTVSNYTRDFPSYKLPPPPGRPCDLDISMVSAPNNTQNCSGGGIYVSPCPDSYFGYCFTLSNQMTTFNTGNSGADVTVVLPGGMYLVNTPVTSCMTTTATTGDTTLIWTLSNAIPSGGTCTVCFEAYTPPNAPIANSIVSATLALECQNNLLPEEVTTWNNGDNCSCDPNDLAVWPSCGTESYITGQEDLLYRVRFENEGRGAAHFIVVRDRLDANIDLSGIRIMSTSHNLTRFQIEVGEEDAILVLAFDDIELQPEEQGYIFFEARLKDHLVDGTNITNQANIYFDSMPPVTTNEVFNVVLQELEHPLSSDMQVQHSQSEVDYIYHFQFTGYSNDAVDVNWNFGPNAVPSVAEGVQVSRVEFSNAGPHNVTVTSSRCDGDVSESTSIILEAISWQEFVTGNEIVLCSKGTTIMASLSDLASHMNIGDDLGTCAPTRSPSSAPTSYNAILKEATHNQHTPLLVIGIVCGILLISVLVALATYRSKQMNDMAETRAMQSYSNPQYESPELLEQQQDSGYLDISPESNVDA